MSWLRANEPYASLPLLVDGVSLSDPEDKGKAFFDKVVNFRPEGRDLETAWSPLVPARSVP